jgi:hypothetical protein
MLGLKKIGAELTEEEKKQLKAKEDSTKNQANFDKALMSLRESMHKALLPLIGYVEKNIVNITKALEKFVRQFVEIMEGPGGLKGALLHGVKEIGKILGPALKEMFSSMLTNPYVIGGLVAGFAILFGSTLVQLALARSIMKAMNRDPSSLELPDTPDRNKPGGKTPGKGGKIPFPRVPTPGAGSMMRGSLAAILMSIPGNVGQDYPWPQDGPYAGMEINPATGRPWDKPDLEEYKKDPAAYAQKNPRAGSATPVSMFAPETALPYVPEDATSKEAMKMRAESIIQIKELTAALDKLDYNKLIIPESANKSIEINTGKMRLLRGEVNALTTSFKNLNDTGLARITKGINSLSGEFKIFNEGFSLFKKSFEELDRTTERAALETMTDQLDKLNTNAMLIVGHTEKTATHTRAIKGATGTGK